MLVVRRRIVDESRRLPIWRLEVGGLRRVRRLRPFAEPSVAGLVLALRGEEDCWKLLGL